MSREAQLMTIPMGQSPRPCSRGCGTLIYFARHPNTNNWHPVTLNDPRAIAPTDSTNGFGITHFADCEVVIAERRRDKLAVI